MTKKEIKERNKLQRVFVPINTGTRVHKSAKDYDRRRNKVDLRKIDLWFFYNNVYNKRKD